MLACLAAGLLGAEVLLRLTRHNQGTGRKWPPGAPAEPAVKGMKEKALESKVGIKRTQKQTAVTHCILCYLPTSHFWVDTLGNQQQPCCPPK